MEQKNQLLGVMKLPNGLDLFFHGESSKTAGDRWRVQLRIEIPIEIEESLFAECDRKTEAFEAFVKENGGKVHFEQKKVRNFIADADIEDTLNAMKQEFIESGLPYVSIDGFAPKFVMKTFGEHAKQYACRVAHEKAMREVE